MWWFFDTEFVHSIYFRDFIFLSVNFTHAEEELYTNLGGETLPLLMTRKKRTKRTKELMVKRPNPTLKRILMVKKGNLTMTRKKRTKLTKE